MGCVYKFFVPYEARDIVGASMVKDGLIVNGTGCKTFLELKQEGQYSNFAQSFAMDLIHSALWTVFQHTYDPNLLSVPSIARDAERHWVLAQSPT